MTDANLLATLRYPHDERILALFAPEDKDLGRASYAVALDADCVLFTVHAQDATAMRAALSTITKVLSVWEATRSHGSSK